MTFIVGLGAMASPWQIAHRVKISDSLTPPPPHPHHLSPHPLARGPRSLFVLFARHLPREERAAVLSRRWIR